MKKVIGIMALVAIHSGSVFSDTLSASAGASSSASAMASSMASSMASATGGNGFGGSGGEASSVSQGGLGGMGGAASNTGNAQSVLVDQHQVRQSPASFMNVPMPTAPCQATIGGFLSFIGGIGVAGSRTLEECEIRESARIAHGVGQSDMAKEIMCMGKYAVKTSQCKKHLQEEK